MKDVLIAFGEPVHRLSGDEVIQRIAYMLALGRIHICSAQSEAGSNVAGDAIDTQESASRPARSEAAAQPAASPAPASEPDTFHGAVDEAGTAAALTKAAEEGTPFCEECSKPANAR